MSAPHASPATPDRTASPTRAESSAGAESAAGTESAAGPVSSAGPETGRPAGPAAGAPAVHGGPGSLTALEAAAPFATRHVGTRAQQQARMLAAVGYASMEDLVAAAVPGSIADSAPLALPPAADEAGVQRELRDKAARNRTPVSMIGLGYSDTLTPPVIRRNIMENPSWYTAYTPYQPEISQGRLEALLNFQTVVADLSGLPTANASLLDEATAAAEAVALARRVSRSAPDAPMVLDADCLPQTIAVIRTRAEPMGIPVVVRDLAAEGLPDGDLVGLLVQYPGASGAVGDHAAVAAEARRRGAVVAVAADLLALTVLPPPGEWGADVVVGSAQRFGVPLGFGGPHAGFMSFREGLLWPQPGGLGGVTAVARRVHRYAAVLAAGLRAGGVDVRTERFFDTVTVRVPKAAGQVVDKAARRGINLRLVDADHVAIATDEVTRREHLDAVWAAFGVQARVDELDRTVPDALGATRESEFLTHPVFAEHHSETAMLRYLKRLADFDYALDRGMIPLGSCTMKLNAAAEMEPVSYPGFAAVHPFAPAEQVPGYLELIGDLESWLAEITGYDAVSLQPNAGSQGELAGLLAIHAYHAANGDADRDVCLIPQSAHGTNAASAAMAGMRVVVVKTRDNGDVDLDDLRAKIDQHRDRLAALMVTYPSTHGVFEQQITEVCAAVHDAGGQVYVDGANLNALVGLARPGRFGADVSHLNLHKTFCIPHGGGGPGIGPVAARAHLAPYLPNHPLQPLAGPPTGPGPVSAAPWGSASILPISWAYVRLMGPDGLVHATRSAILAANYVAARLRDHFPVLYTGRDGLVAHECIVDLRPLTKQTGVTVEDVAKRLIDYGFHAPTMSFPVAGTLMIEPTESEDLAELDRFVAAMIAIRGEIDRVASGDWDGADNPLRNAPHTAAMVTADKWERPYGRELAAYPAGEAAGKYWPPVRRVDGAYGDRNLVCACPPVAAYED